MSRASLWSIARSGARLVLGARRYSGLRERLWALKGELTPSPVRLRQLRSELLEARTQFKDQLLRALVRQRVLEKELAQLKYPALYRSNLDVVAEILRQGDMPIDCADTVSVLITNYNYAQYLPEAIESALAQTYEKIEVLVIDDASRDESPEVLERLLGQPRRIPCTRVLLKHNVGLPGARNLGVSVARGEFVFILDADNRLLPKCLEVHIECARATSADAVYGRIRTFGAASSLPGFLSDAPFSSERLSTGNYIDAMALFRRDALLDAGLYSTEAVLYGVEDYELWLRFAAQGRKVGHIPTVLSEYRVHGENMLRVTQLDLRETWAYLRARYPGVLSGAPDAERGSP